MTRIALHRAECPVLPQSALASLGLSRGSNARLATERADGWMVGTSPTMTTCSAGFRATKLGARGRAICGLLALVAMLLAWSVGPGFAADPEWTAIEAAARKVG